MIKAGNLTKYFRHSEQKRTSEDSHVTNDAIALSFVQEVVYGKCGIDDFSVAENSGKVLTIIIYCL